VTAAGQYPVTLTSSGGCDSIVTTNLTVNSVLTASVDASICQGQTFTLPDGSSVTAAGQYPVTLTSSGGCDSIVTTNLTVSSVLTTSVDASICQGQSFTLPDGSTVTSAGQYPVTLTSSGGCDSIVTTNLTVNDLPEALVIAPALICDGDSLVVTANLNAGESILWPDGSTGLVSSLKKKASLRSLISNECGEVSSEVEISTEDCTPCAVYLPNAFTPNGDGVNDLFAPIITCDAVEPFLFRIYNRWNELVFETTNPLDSWDGIYKNTKQPTDAYVYYLRYFNGKTGKEEELKGVVTLLN
jgi:gliding motility-associated-like protein